MNKKNMILIVLIMTTLLSSCVYSATVDKEKFDFDTDEYIFVYNDHNSTIYEGDLGLLRAICVNKYDNKTYSVSKDIVRGMAYATNRTFKFNETMQIWKNNNSGSDKSFDYFIARYFYPNGTKVPILSIDNSSLTSEQIKYFDNYESQKNEYYQQQYEYGIDNLYSQQQSYHSKQKSKWSYYGGTNGFGFIYTPQ